MWMILAVMLWTGDEPVTVTVPEIEGEPVIDNRLASDEWAHAAVYELAEGGRVLLARHGQTLFLAFDQMPEARFGYGCIFVHGRGGIEILHASAQLGSARYRRQGSSWMPENKKYAWKKADVIWREEQWQAGTNPEGTQEFAVDLDVLGKEPRIAMSYILLGKERRVVGWPAGLDDDTRNLELMGGWNPEAMVFQTARWARLRLEVP